MDSSAAQNVRKASSSEKRNRKDPVNRIARSKAVEGFERANPVPVAHLGPVPPVAEQMAELMTNPAWVMARMKEHQAETLEVKPDDFQDWDDDDDNFIFTGYEVFEPDEYPVDLPPESPQSGPQPEAGTADGLDSAPQPEDAVHKSTDGQDPPRGV